MAIKSSVASATRRTKSRTEATVFTEFFLTQIPKFGIVLVLVLVLGALGFRDRKETDVLQLICSVSLIAKRSGFSRTRTTTSRVVRGRASAGRATQPKTRHTQRKHYPTKETRRPCAALQMQK